MKRIRFYIDNADMGSVVTAVAIITIAVFASLISVAIVVSHLDGPAKVGALFLDALISAVFATISIMWGETW